MTFVLWSVYLAIAPWLTQANLFWDYWFCSSNLPCKVFGEPWIVLALHTLNNNTYLQRRHTVHTEEVIAAVEHSVEEGPE